MGKITKYSNLYDKHGDLLRTAPLEEYTIKELEDAIDQQKDPQIRNNMITILIGMYQKYGNPHEDELIKRIKEQTNNKLNETAIRQALDELRSSIFEEQEGETGTSEEETSKTNEESSEELGYDVNNLDTEDAIIVEEAA